jgi:F-type H+-transporting ATPase subunit b
MKEALNEVVKSGLLPNPISFVAQLISTFILFYFLKRLVWKPMQELLEKRKDVIVGELESAKTLNENAKRDKELSQLELAKVKDDSIRMIELAKVQANEARENILKEAAKEAQYKVQKAEKEIERERVLAEKEIKARAIEIGFSVAEKLVNENLDDQRNRKMVESFIDEV